MLSFSQVSNGITINRNIIKLHNKNQIFADSVLSAKRQIAEVIWILEQFVYTDYNGTDMFSVFDGFPLLEDAVTIGMRLNDRTQERIVDEILSKREKGCA